MPRSSFPFSPIGDKQKRGGKKAKEEEAKRAASVIADAGLAWRRERRRAKLSVRALRQLLTVAHRFAGKQSHYPHGPVSGLDGDATTTNGSDQPAEATEGTTGEEQDKQQQQQQEEDDEQRSVSTAISSCPDAALMAELEERVQKTLDEIVKVSLPCYSFH